MTTLTFKENIIIDNKKPINITDFLEILSKQWFLPSIEELNNDEITPEILNSFLLSKKSKNRINI